MYLVLSIFFSVSIEMTIWLFSFNVQIAYYIGRVFDIEQSFRLWDKPCLDCSIFLNTSLDSIH